MYIGNLQLQTTNFFLFLSLGTLGNFAKATYAAIAKTYAYLTPDLWKEMPLSRTPYQEYADFLVKNHKPSAPGAPARPDGV